MRRIVITGASSQIGTAIARKLASDGDQVVLQYFRNPPSFAAIDGRRRETCSTVSVDLSDREALAKFCANLGEVDILVNAAAVTDTGLLPSLSDDDIMSMIGVNIVAAVALCRAVIPAMVHRRSGCIVNITSVSASKANRGQSVYAGTKGFIESFSRGLAAEYGSRGIRVNCVAPGPIEAGSLLPLLALAPDEVRHSVAAHRLGTPDDVASAVAYLCSPDASFINGHTLRVDGGFMKGV